MVSAQIMRPEDLEKYAKHRYGEKWVDAAANLASELVLDKNNNLTYQQVIPAPGKSKGACHDTCLFQCGDGQDGIVGNEDDDW